MDQLSFASLDFAAKKKRTKRDVFLTEMAAVVPWGARAVRMGRKICSVGESRESVIFGFAAGDKDRSWRIRLVGCHIPARALRVPERIHRRRVSIQ